MAARLFTLTIASLAAVTSAAPAAPDIAAPPSRTRLSFPQIDGDYAPKPVRCPGGDLVRSAEGIGRAEAEFLRRRKGKADGALAEWLARQGDFGTASQPRVGLASSGGGYRALLETAGVVQAFDGREGNSSTSGLFQGLSYQSGLSGMYAAGWRVFVFVFVFVLVVADDGYRWIVVPQQL
jgi:lysophospholipase